VPALRHLVGRLARQRVASCRLEQRLRRLDMRGRVEGPVVDDRQRRFGIQDRGRDDLACLQCLDGTLCRGDRVGLRQRSSAAIASEPRPPAYMRISAASSVGFCA
jgi:hypothetical protein